MDEFKKQRVLIGLVALLVVLNLMALGTLYMALMDSHEGMDYPGPMMGRQGPPGGPPDAQGGASDFIISQLRLRPDQAEQLRSQWDEDFQNLRELQDQLFEARLHLHETLFQDTSSPSDVEGLAQHVAEIQSRIELMRLDHFRNIIALCDDDQQILFRELLEEVLSNTQPPHRGHGPGGPGGPPDRFPEGGGPPPFGGPMGER